jgi:hypothetical protein
MPRRRFSVSEVNALIPQLESAFSEIVQLHAAFRRHEEVLRRLGLEPSRDLLADNVDAAKRRHPDARGDLDDVRRAQSMFRALYESLLESVGRVSVLGGEVKDIESGLVDFPAVRGGQEVLLCWRLGEKSISHWHPFDGGFSTRRPIDELIETASVLDD